MADGDFSSIALRVTLVVLAAAVIILLISYYSSSSKTQVPQKAGVEKFDVSPASMIIQEQNYLQAVAPQVGAKESPSDGSTIAGWQPTTDFGDVPKSDDFKSSLVSDTVPGSYPQDRTTPQDLLPPKSSETSAWAQAAPSNQGDVSGQNFLSSGYHIGKDTIGQTHKNPNLTLRSEPPNPKINVSPWMNSSYEPDLIRKGFEIGSDQ